MRVNLNEENIGAEIYGCQGEIPNADVLSDGNLVTLFDVADCLYKDGDYYYEYEKSYQESGFCGVTVHVCAFGAGEMRGMEVEFDNAENDEVGRFDVAFHVDCVDEIIEYLRK